MIVGASTGALYPHETTEDAIDVLARLGFPVLEIMLQTAGEYAPAFARLLAGRARDAGVAVHAVHAFTGLHPLFDPYARRREEGMDAFRRGIDLAAEVGAGAIVWHGLTRRDQESGVGPERYREVLATVAGESRAAGVTLAIENVSWCAVRDAKSVAAVRAWDLPVGFALDPFQAVEAGVEIAEVAEGMRGALVDVHLSDYATGRGRHLPPGEGEIDWRGFVRLLACLGYDGPLIIEGVCDGDLARLARARDLLRGLLP